MCQQTMASITFVILSWTNTLILVRKWMFLTKKNDPDDLNKKKDPQVTDYNNET